jgi:hypothetical protein
MSFLNPLFLLGIAAVAAPVLVHLVRRSRARRVEFPSLMFVRRVPQRTIRRKKLHNLLLLALRCLALLLLVAAFTRPYLSSNNTPAGSNARASLILLDNSFSMRYGGRFDRARSRAQAIVNEARSGDQLALITFNQSYEVAGRWTTEASKIQALIASAEAGLGATNYEQALRGAEELLKETGARERRIFLISDFQQSGWLRNETSFRLARDIQLLPVDVGEGPASNIAITGVSARPVIYQQKYDEKLAVDLTNFSDEARDAVKVEFQINDQPVEKREIKMEPQGTRTLEFTGFNLSEGSNRGVIAVSGDDFTLDNRFYFTLRREPQSKALIIETAARGQSDSLYLRNALMAGDNLPYTLAVKTAGTVNPAEIGEYRTVIINDARGVSTSLAAALARLVEAGGGLIIAAGPRTDAAEFNQKFQEVAPATLEEIVQLRSDPIALSETKTDHPIFEVFQQSGRLAAARVTGYYRAAPRENSTVLARYEDSSPALIEKSLGEGKVLLFTSTFDAAWTDLPLTPIYLPLVRQMMRYLGERETEAWHPLGQAFTVPKAKDGTPPAVDDPAGTRLTDRTLSATGDLIVVGREPGFYKLRYPERAEFAAVDLDGAESDFTRLNIEEFIAAVTEDPAEASPVPAARSRLSEEEIESRQRIWWPLLLLALLLFAAEALLARRTKMARVIG